jgi:Lon protease-like protein
MGELPMFPLGTVLFPTAVLPLHIFEPRYRKLMADCLAGDREFGVVLIERGSEVGGGDVRTDIGTVAQLVATNELPDGRWFVVTVGTRRIRVLQWLDDDPYPRAEVEPWEDAPDQDAVSSEDYAALLGSARRLLALAAEVGAPAGEATTTFADDPALGSFQVAAAAPFGPFDKQRVLVTQGSGARCALLRELLADQLELLQESLGGDDDAPAGGGEAPER